MEKTITRNEGGEGAAAPSKRIEGSQWRSKAEEYQMISNLTGFDNLRAVMEEEATVNRRKRRRRRRRRRRNRNRKNNNDFQFHAQQPVPVSGFVSFFSLFSFSGLKDMCLLLLN